MFELHHGDCLATLKTFGDNSVDSIVTDPPYGLSFMGKRWDYDVPSTEVWAECLRVLKPGGHLLAFAGTRTQHRMAVHIEDAGFEIRDMIAWVYGSGFPKSLDVSKAIDKAAGAEREVVATVKKTPSAGGANTNEGWQRPWAEGKTTMDITAPATESARQWQGWGTALKPALEPITVARKPLIGTVAENVLAHGTGAINVDGCRVGDEVRWNPAVGELTGIGSSREAPKGEGREVTGRWPANLIHDGSDEPTGLLGDAARFFYCAKASKRDRDEGLEGFASARAGVGDERPSGSSWERRAPEKNPNHPRANIHPTVKPTDLMAYLCRLVTPPGGLVLDPFMGSGSTGKAAMREGFRFIGCELSPEYMEIARARIAHALWGDLA